MATPRKPMPESAVRTGQAVTGLIVETMTMNSNVIIYMRNADDVSALAELAELRGNLPRIHLRLLQQARHLRQDNGRPVRHAEAARLDAISTILTATQSAADAAGHLRRNDPLSALADLGDLQAHLATACVILHQQATGTYHGLAGATTDVILHDHGAFSGKYAS